MEFTPPKSSAVTFHKFFTAIGKSIAKWLHRNLSGLDPLFEKTVSWDLKNLRNRNAK